MGLHASEDGSQQHTNECKEGGCCTSFGEGVECSRQRAEEGYHSANRCEADRAYAMCCSGQSHCARRQRSDAYQTSYSNSGRLSKHEVPRTQVSCGAPM